MIFEYIVNITISYLVYHCIPIPFKTRCFWCHRFLLRSSELEDGCTALMFAAMSGHGPIVSELMKVGFRDMVDVPGVVFF